MEGKAIIAMYGNAARDILRSAAPGGLSPGSALDLAEVEAKYQSVAARLDVNEPDVLAVYKALLACRREYLRVHEWRREGCDKKCAPWYHSFQSKSFRPIATPSRKPGNISEPGEAIRKPSVPTGWWSVVGKHGKTVKILEEEAAPSKCLQALHNATSQLELRLRPGWRWQWRLGQPCPRYRQHGTGRRSPARRYTQSLTDRLSASRCSMRHKRTQYERLRTARSAEDLRKTLCHRSRGEASGRRCLRRGVFRLSVDPLAARTPALILALATVAVPPGRTHL